MKKVSIKRILVGLIIGGIIVGLAIYVIDYLWCSSVDIVVAFKSGIDEEMARSILLKYDNDITITWIVPDGDDGLIFEVSASHRIKAYFIKSKLSKEINIKSVKFGTILAPLEDFPFKN